MGEEQLRQALFGQVAAINVVPWQVVEVHDPGRVTLKIEIEEINFIKVAPGVKR